MGLRLADGIDRALFPSVTGADPVAALDERRWRPWSRRVSSGRRPHLTATAAGRQRLNAVLERLIA